MSDASTVDFTFVVITFNHEAFVLEHLESIAYQIRHHGQGLTFQLLIADDASKDRTVRLIDFWVRRHADLFVDTRVVTQPQNHGTCHNFTKVWDLVRGRQCKFTAGDDVYSCENLIAEWQRMAPCTLASGLPLHLIDGVLSVPKFFILNALATNLIYQRDSYTKRLTGIGFSNTPSMIFSNEVLHHAEIRDFIRQFFVTEDYPLHVKMAEVFSPLVFCQSPLIHVYYRRTAHSTYLIKGELFNQDKLSIFQYLRERATLPIDRLLLSNRIFCYLQKNSAARRLLNLNYAVYLARFLWKLLPILHAYRSIQPDTNKHRKHYATIHELARRGREECGC